MQGVHPGYGWRSRQSLDVPASGSGQHQLLLLHSACMTVALLAAGKKK
jgi:hypothetical protein